MVLRRSSCQVYHQIRYERDGYVLCWAHKEQSTSVRLWWVYADFPCTVHDVTRSYDGNIIRAAHTPVWKGNIDSFTKFRRESLTKFRFLLSMSTKRIRVLSCMRKGRKKLKQRVWYVYKRSANHSGGLPSPNTWNWIRELARRLQTTHLRLLAKITSGTNLPGLGVKEQNHLSILFASVMFLHQILNYM